MGARAGESSRPAGTARWPLAGRLVAALLVVEVLLFGLSTLPGVRPSAGFLTPVDGWLQGLGYVTAAVLAVLRAVLRAADRAGWSWVAAALVARALGFVLWLTVVRPQRPVPAPSVADAAWLAMYPLLLVGVVLLTRRRARLLTTSLTLDGAVAVLAAASLAVGLLHPTLMTIAGAPGAATAIAVGLAYPVLDLMLIVVVVGLLVVFGRRPPPAAWALATGVAGFAAVDALYLYLITADSWRPGTPISSGSLALMAVVAASGWLPDGSTTAPPQREALPDALLPAGAALVCLGVLVFATQVRVSLLAVVAAGAGLVVIIVRIGLSYRTVRALAEHRREARTDELTGLANRRGFTEGLAGALAQRPADGRLALLVVDLDDFKAVNDALGHHHGDELLRQTASRLQQVVRSGDLVARIGGDEFTVLLTDADAPLAVSVAERLRAGFRRPFRLASRDVVIAPSVGIALVPGDGREPGEVLQHADLAMHVAKARRSGQAFYRPELHSAGPGRLETTERLRRAIEQGELLLHYQPQITLPTGEIRGVEALVRWQHPESGLVPPAQFLPQAESGGLMPALTALVLGQALRQMADWRRRGHQLTVAVNLSVTNLLDPEFPQQVIDALAAARLPAWSLELELTEDLFMADPARARGAVATLLDAGVGLVIDDYGTGYSSLGYLRDLQEIRGLKLDKSFVSRLDVEPRSAAIVESTVDLAHSLGMHVVAEGVETPPVRDRLAELGCEFAQGWLFAPPLPAAEVVTLFDGAPEALGVGAPRGRRNRPERGDRRDPSGR